MRSGLNKEELRKLQRKRQAARKALLDEIAEREQRKKEARGTRSGLSKAELRKLAKGKPIEKSVDLTEKALFDLARKSPVNGYLVDDIVRHMRGNTKQIILTEIRRGLRDGKSVEQIVKALQGTKADKYRNGSLNTVRNALKRDINTIVNHVTNVVYEETYKAAGYDEVDFVALLDSKTSEQCRSLNGKRYSIHKPYPRPPLHPNCRSKIRPVRKNK